MQERNFASAFCIFKVRCQRHLNPATPNQFLPGVSFSFSTWNCSAAKVDVYSVWENEYLHAIFLHNFSALFDRTVTGRSKSSFGRQMSGQLISSDYLSYCHDFILSLL